MLSYTLIVYLSVYPTYVTWFVLWFNCYKQYFHITTEARYFEHLPTGGLPKTIHLNFRVKCDGVVSIIDYAMTCLVQRSCNQMGAQIFGHPVLYSHPVQLGSWSSDTDAPPRRHMLPCIVTLYHYNWGNTLPHDPIIAMTTLSVFSKRELQRYWISLSNVRHRRYNVYRDVHMGLWFNCHGGCRN